MTPTAISLDGTASLEFLREHVLQRKGSGGANFPSVKTIDRA